MAKEKPVDDFPATKYPNYDPKSNVILDVARAARRLEKAFPDERAANVIQHLENPSQDWWWDFIDIILDYEEAQDAE